MYRRSLSGLVLIALVASVCGCETRMDYDSLKLVPVTGKVMLDGSPLSDARVQFIGNDGSGAEGITDASGQYTLKYDSNKSGATPGAKVVKITTANDVAADDPDAVSTSEKVPAKYNTKSELKVQVSESSPTHNFDLSSK